MKVIEIDRQGRINLSRKEAMPQENSKADRGRKEDKQTQSLLL